MLTNYQRRDFAIRLYLDGLDAVLSIQSPEGTKSEARWPRNIIDLASSIPKEVTDAVRRSISGNEHVVIVRPDQTIVISRVTIEVDRREWASLNWESLNVGSRLIVRVSQVRPRVLQIPITFPIRALEIGGTPIAPQAIFATFYGTPRGNAFVEGHTTLFDAESFPMRESWPTVEILQVHDLPDGENLISNSNNSPAGTAGWFLRFAQRFQTRLIVLDGYASAPPAHRRLAQTIIDRGGPPVLLLDNNLSASERFYGDMSHDRPLDWIHMGIPGSELFCGTGGEEVLRYTAIARELSPRKVASLVKKTYTAAVRPTLKKVAIEPVIDIPAITLAIVTAATEMKILDGTNVRVADLWGTRAQRLGHSLAAELPRHGLVASGLGLRFESLRAHTSVMTTSALTDYIVKSSRPIRKMSRRGVVNVLSTKLDDIIQSGIDYRYEDQESEGMLPLAAKVADMRALLNVVSGPRAASRGVSRFVNSAFYNTGFDGKLQKIPQEHARFKLNEVVHLGIQIGPKDELIVSLGPTRFLEEKVHWDTEGAWMEIGVTGIDFDIVGDPVQQFYLTRIGESDLIAFAVRPFKSAPLPGVGRLRFTIYQRNNIVQSFFVVAALEEAPSDVSSTMARVLGLRTTPKKLRYAGYVSRLEYNTATNINDTDGVTDRDLTIVANDSAGDKVTTFKGDDLFQVSKDDHSTIVEGARKTLEEASRRSQAYRYESFDNINNAGDPKELVDILPDIAYDGWQLYNALVPDPNDQDKIRSRIEKGTGIHAAHIDFSNVIPWSMIYDRKVFFDRNLAPPSVCLASMPDKTGKMPNVECGGVGCLLSQAGYRKDRVICPRRFWGFMFPIDVPAQKVEGESSTNLVEQVKVGDPIKVVAGYNGELDYAKTHVADLKDTTLKQAAFKSESGRLPVYTLIEDNDPEIAYFYCHALAKTVTKDGKDLGPTLDFGLGFKGVIEDVLRPADFGGEPAWTHTPLVFINGCNTAGFSPYAPSEFIKQFIRAKHASAVVGTETTIVEILAIEVAKTFFEAMLEGLSAGDAILRVRRLLLAKNNPLGLMYTLYGSSRLTFVKGSPAAAIGAHA